MCAVHVVCIFTNFISSAKGAREAISGIFFVVGVNQHVSTRIVRIIVLLRVNKN